MVPKSGNIKLVVKYTDLHQLFVKMTLYIGSNDNSLYALKSDDGSKLWSYETGDAINCSLSWEWMESFILDLVMDIFTQYKALPSLRIPLGRCLGKNDCERTGHSITGYASFMLTDGSGDDDNAAFTIAGDELPTGFNA